MIISVYSTILILTLINEVTSILKEYCSHEYFQPKCSSNEVVVIEKAIYGRMKLGKCLIMDPNDQNINNSRYIGCYSEVVDIMDQRCSGLKTCNVLAIDPELIRRSKCYPGLMLYLEAEYSCYSIALPDRSCSLIVGNEPLHVSISDTSESSTSNCFTRGSSLFLEASHGQTINVAITEFSQMVIDSENKTHLGDDTNNAVCNRGYKSRSSKEFFSELLVTITSIINNDKVQQEYICSGGQRIRNVFSSKSNKVELQFAQRTNKRFLLSFTATGCHDLKPPQDGWMKRKGNEITVGCHMNRHTWKLVCNGRNWLGTIGNCSQLNEPFELDINLSVSKTEIQTSQAEHAFVFLLLISLTILILTVISCAILICCQRKKYLQTSKDIYLANGHLSNKITNGNLFMYQSPLEENQLKETTTKLNDSEPPLESCYYVLEEDK